MLIGWHAACSVERWSRLASSTAELPTGGWSRWANAFGTRWHPVAGGGMLWIGARLRRSSSESRSVILTPQTIGTCYRMDELPSKEDPV